MLIHETRRLNEIFTALAELRGGQVIRKAGQLSAYPEIVIDHHGLDTAIEVKRGGYLEHHLALHILHRGKAKSPGCSMVLHRTTPLSNWLFHVTGRFGFRQNPKRPGWFEMETGDTDFVKRCLDPDLAGPMLRLFRQDDPEVVSVAAGASLFFVQRPEPLWSTEGLEEFVTASLAIFDALEARPQLHPPPDTGMWIVADMVRAIEPPRCGVCAERIAGPRAVCTLCLTPSHADCWTWTGQCSVYGCGSMSARVE